MTTATASAQRVFPNLPTEQDALPFRRLRICIASPDLVGPVRNGGIGTAYTALADALAEAGHDVICLYSHGTHCSSHDINHWVNHYHARGIKFVPMPHQSGNLQTSTQATRSYEAYHWLKRQEAFDFIHFPEWQGLGYYSMLAKKQGLAFGQTQLCVGLHSMTSWVKEGSSEFLEGQLDLQLDFMERESVALCDAVISPSQYLLNWVIERGWQLPDRAYVQQNVMPRSSRCAGEVAVTEVRAIDELVFFGRLETRKGIVLFCDALDRLPTDVARRIKRVTFLGKEGQVKGVKGETFIHGRAKEWKWETHVASDRDQPQAVHYLRGKGRLAVMPSLMENSPYTVLECLGAGIAFIATRVGGIPELIYPSDVDAVCFEKKAAALGEKITRAVTAGFQLARASVDAVLNEQIWTEWHQLSASRQRASVTRAVEPTAWPKVSVCMVTINRPNLLVQAISSLRAVTYPNFEVILVDDGSTKPEALALLDELEPEFAGRGWRILRQANRYLGAARNHAVRNSTAEFILFMDDDNFAEPGEITALVRAALHSGADILTCGMNQFSGDLAPVCTAKPERRWLPLGNAVAAGALCNVFGDANALVRRTCFDGVGGFTEDYGVGHEDWEFFASAALKGFKLQVVPEFLFWYRVSPNSMLRTADLYQNYMRNVRPYLGEVPASLRPLLLLAQASVLRPNEGPSAQAVMHYTDLTVLWKSKLGAALVLMELGQAQHAAKLMLDAVKSVGDCKSPQVILEALLGVCAHLGKLDVGRARYLLNLAVETATKMGRDADLAHARALLAELPAAQRSAA